MDGVAHGRLLAGRYLLQERVRSGSDGALWRAVDETLDRPVSVRVVRVGHRRTADVVDAARRAALVGDPRLVRVLDVGQAGGSAYIVSEHLVGRTLDELIANGPLAPEVARRLAGEAAEALDRASARGLHHLRLAPASLVVTPDGDVKVLGTAVEAALAGVEHEEDPPDADREDAVGLVRRLYAALTGRWPGAADGPTGTLAPAPAHAVTGDVVPPGDLVPDVPNDLDTLCTVTLGPHDDGPRSPGELARELAPWPAAAPVLPSAPGPAAAEPPAVTQPAAGVEPSTGAAAFAGEPFAPYRPAVDDDEADVPVELLASAGARRATPARGVLRSGSHDGGSHDGGRLDGGAPSSPAWRRPPPDDDWSLLTPPGGWPVPAAAQQDTEAPLGPFMPQAPLSRPSRDQARIVIAVVAGLVVLGLVLAVVGVIGMTSSAPLVSSSTAPRTGPPTAGATSPATPSASGGTPASTSPSGSATGAARIAGIQAIDPEGDGDENGSTAVHAIDGDPQTTWRSQGYRSPEFGGLKHGLGLYLHLDQGTVTSVSVALEGSGGTVELRTVTGPQLDGSAVVATGSVSGGRVVLTPGHPLAADRLLVWFTGLPQLGSGEYRLVVSEITVS